MEHKQVLVIVGMVYGHERQLY